MVVEFSVDDLVENIKTFDGSYMDVDPVVEEEDNPVDAVRTLLHEFRRRGLDTGDIAVVAHPETRNQMVVGYIKKVFGL